ATSAVSVRMLTHNIYPSASKIVPIYTSFPERPYERLAELSTAALPEARGLLREKARSLGADALIILPAGGQLAAVSESVNPRPGAPAVTMIRAVAIRYERQQ
ncbi:MAG: hypothetical protein ACT4O1_07255, partial [Gemmatimonadota bacterium]